ncbi:MAG: IS110 family transposase [Bacteroidota bacterium]
MKNWIGIDPSHETFTVAFCQEGSGFTKVNYDQNEENFARFAASLSEQDEVLIEHTGSYSAALVHFLYQKRGRVHLVSARTINGFRIMKGYSNKTDQRDAIAIAEYAQLNEQALTAWTPPETEQVGIKVHCGILAQLIKQRASWKHMRHSYRLDPLTPEEAIKQIDQIIEDLDQRIKHLEQEIETRVQRYQAHADQLLQSIPGIGKRTSAALIAWIGDFSRFHSARALSAYLGLTPKFYRSGSSVRRKPKISKIGPAYLRQLLYLCASNAARWNPLAKQMYERLLEKGKNKQAALIAVANKLVRIAWAVVSKQTPFNPNFLAKT